MSDERLYLDKNALQTSELFKKLIKDGKDVFPDADTEVQKQLIETAGYICWRFIMGAAVGKDSDAWPKMNRK